MRALFKACCCFLFLIIGANYVQAQDAAIAGFDDLCQPCQGHGCSLHNKFLYWAERGQALMLAQAYEESNFCFEQAFTLWIDRSYHYEKSNEDSYDEVHEFMMVIYYKTLNYLSLGKLEDAMVECRRLNDWLLNSDMNPVVAKLINDDPLIHSIMGIVFDLSNQTDDALICYDNALRSFAINYRGLMSKHLPRLLIRESELLYSRPYLREGYGPVSSKHPAGRLMVIWNNGEGPAALVRKHDFHIRNADLVSDDVDVNIVVDEIQDTLLSFFKFREPVYRNWEITRNGNKVIGELLVDESWYAIHALEYRLKSPGMHVWRQGSNWSTLPHSIFFAIIPLQDGANNFRFTMKGDRGLIKTDSLSIVADGGSHFYVLNTPESRNLKITTRVVPTELPGFLLRPD